MHLSLMIGFIFFVPEEFKKYLNTNTSPETNPLILWDSAKAYIRGYIISFVSAKRREGGQQRELEDKIKELERKHKQSVRTNIANECHATRRQPNGLLWDKVHKFKILQIWKQSKKTISIYTEKTPIFKYQYRKYNHKNIQQQKHMKWQSFMLEYRYML